MPLNDNIMSCMQHLYGNKPRNIHPDDEMPDSTLDPLLLGITKSHGGSVIGARVRNVDWYVLLY